MSATDFYWYESTYIINPYDRNPRFHRYGRIKDETDVTACGKLIYANGCSYAVGLPRGHSEAIGRACRSCFPALSADGTADAE